MYVPALMHKATPQRSTGLCSSGLANRQLGMPCTQIGMGKLSIKYKPF